MLIPIGRLCLAVLLARGGSGINLGTLSSFSRRPLISGMVSWHYIRYSISIPIYKLIFKVFKWTVAGGRMTSLQFIFYTLHSSVLESYDISLLPSPTQDHIKADCSSDLNWSHRTDQWLAWRGLDESQLDVGCGPQLRVSLLCGY